MHLRDVGDDRRRSKQVIQAINLFSLVSCITLWSHLIDANMQEERVFEAIQNMQRIFTGVHGKLGDLCKPIQKRYAQASTQCLRSC